MKNMDISFPIEKKDISENVVNPFFISGYLESRNQLRAKEMDEPISHRQRLCLDCYLGQDLSACGSPAQAGWIRGFASGYFDDDPAVRDWTDDNDEIYYVELNEAYLTIDTERMDFILGKKMMRWGTVSHRLTQTNIRPAPVK